MAVVLTALTGCGEQRVTLRMLTPTLQLDQEIAADLVDIFERHSRHEIVLVPIPDSAETALDALESGYADLALTSNAQPFREGVATVMPLYPTVLHIFSRRDRDSSDPRSLLLGANVYAGPAGSSSRLAMADILKGLDMSEGEVSFVDSAVNLPDIIVIYIPISPDIVNDRLSEMDAVKEYEMLSFGSPDEIDTGSEIDRAVLLNPRLSPFVIPVGTYGEMQPEAVVSLAVDKLLVARNDLPVTTVYDLINEIRRLQPALSAGWPLLFQGLSDEFDASGSTFVLHAGAQAFTQRDAPNFYERYSGVAEVLVTLVIGVISGVYAVAQIYQRRRKNRIDVFYTDVMAVRDSITESSGEDDRDNAAAKVRALQNSAFEMLVDEKLAADESFRIFITLSNDIIADLGNSPRSA